VFVGYKAGYNVTNASGKLYISNSETTTPLIYGEFPNTLVKINGTASIRDFYTLDEETKDLSTGSTLTPTKSNVKMTASGSITLNTTTPISNGTTAGQVLILRGSDNTNTITINDSGNVNLSGDITLGDSDILMLLWNGTQWIQVSYSNN
jgi:hypothetical protein